MGFAHIIWADHAPIQRVLKKPRAADAELHREIGRSLMDLVVRDSFSAEPEPKASGLRDRPNVFYSAGTAHSSDFKLYVWSGQELLEFSEAPEKRKLASSGDEGVIDDLRFLARIDTLLSRERLVKPMGARIETGPYSQSSPNGKPESHTASWMLSSAFGGYTRIGRESF